MLADIRTRRVGVIVVYQLLANKCDFPSKLPYLLD